MNKGEQLPNEYRALRDERTGARIHQLTADASINHSFFFLNPSFRPGHPEHVAFVTHRGGGAQLALFDFASKTSQCLTAGDGIQAFSPCFSCDGALLFYTTPAGEVWQLDVDSLEEDRLAEITGASVGECSPSPDGRWLVSAARRDGKHGLLIVDIEAREGRAIFETDMKIIHPQFHRTNPEIIEYAGDPRPRLWLIQRDGSGNVCLYENDPREFIVHESFLGPTDDLIFTIWPNRLCRLNIHDREINTIAKTNAWHMASNRDGTRIVADTNHPDRGLLLIDAETGVEDVLCYPEATCQGTQWEEDFAAGPEVWASIRGAAGKELSWMEMKVDSVYGPQWTHPHPAFNDSGDRVVYTSDCSGDPQVYVVEV